MSAGGSQGSSSSESMSDSFSQALGLSNSFNSSFGNQDSFGVNESGSQTFVDPSQAGFTDWARSKAQGVVGSGVGDVTRGAQQGVQELNAAQKVNAGLMDPRKQIAAQEKSLKAGLGNLFNDEINPAIAGASIGNGGFGGGRHGVAQGVAAGQLGQAYTEGLGDITMRANAQASEAASRAPMFAEARTALKAAPASFRMDQLAQFGDLLGSPTVLSSSFGRSQQGATGRSGSSGQSSSSNKAASASKSRANSKSENASFDFGWTV